MMEPSLTSRINNGRGTVDLTTDLLKQGISHWKQISKTVTFHESFPKVKKIPKLPFPTLRTFDEVRIGAQIVRVGDYVLLVDDQLMKVQQLRLSQGELMIHGHFYNQVPAEGSCSYKEFIQRFDPAFECSMVFPVLCRSHWNGDSIVVTDRVVILDD